MITVWSQTRLYNTIFSSFPHRPLRPYIYGTSSLSIVVLAATLVVGGLIISSSSLFSKVLALLFISAGGEDDNSTRTNTSTPTGRHGLFSSTILGRLTVAETPSLAILVPSLVVLRSSVVYYHERGKQIKSLHSSISSF